MRNSIIAVAISLIIGAAIGHYLTPPKEVTKINTVEKEILRRDIRTITVKNPDGTTTTTTVDNSVETKDKKQSQSISKPTEKNRLVSIAGTRDTTNKAIYEITVQARVFGPVFAGASLDTNGRVGAVITYEF